MNRTFRVAASLLLAAFAAVASAQTYPTRSIRVVIGFAAGGATDIINRLVAEDMGRRLGQAVVVENRPGAAALLAANVVRNAPADGYTLYGGSATGLMPVFTTQPINPETELTSITNYTAGDMYIYASSTLNIHNLAELATWAKANPGKLRLASPAAGNTLMFASVMKQLGVPFETIPYKASDQTITALFAGDAQVTVNAAAGFGQHLQSGKMRVLTSFGPRRSELAPEIPTAIEQGVQFETRFVTGLWGPARLPPEIVARLNAAAREALNNPAVVEKIKTFAVLPFPTSPEGQLDMYRRQLALYIEAARLMNYKPE